MTRACDVTTGGRLGGRRIPGDRRPLDYTRANVGLTEDRGQDVWRIKEYLNSQIDMLFVVVFICISSCQL